MPYINKYDREGIDQYLDEVSKNINSAGDLNYTITRLAHNYVERMGGPRYSTYNAAIGVLECAKLELYRRQIADYEDQKIRENGDL